MQKEKYTVAISVKSIAYLILFPLALYFLWIIRDLIFSLLIGFILMSALRPAVNYLTSKRVPRAVAVITIYIFFIFFFVSLISLIIPPIIYETASLIRSLPTYLRDAAPELNGIVNYTDITRLLPNVTNNLLGIVTGVFSNTLFVITTLFFGLYFLLEENMFEDFLKRYFSDGKAKQIIRVVQTAEKRMSSWFWGELILMTVVGVLTFIGLNLIGIRYALPLAVLAGLLEVVPNIGPIISSIPAILIGFGTSYFTGFSAMALYIVVQQLENSLIVPIIMRKAVGINPIITLMALIIGGRIGGILGVLLAIPLFLFIETIFTEVMKVRIGAEKDR